jgi:hypothetical protein
MDRRRFLQNLAVATAGLRTLAANATAPKREADEPRPEAADAAEFVPANVERPDVEGHILICEFEHAGKTWKAFEDLRTRDGSITFLASDGTGRVLTKSAEASFATANPPYLGLTLREIGLSGPDLLADRLLRNGDPDPEQVESAAPPLGSAAHQREYFRLPWDTFVGTKECLDTMPVFPPGNTRTYHPIQYFPELTGEAARNRYDGLLGGWMPAVRKVMPVSATAYYEVLVFGDVEARDEFIVETWHRTAKIENGKILKTVYGYSYPSYPTRREPPKPAEFYRGLLVFADYWDRQLRDAAPANLPDNRWIDMSRHAFAKELMVRPGGVYPKYGAVDRDYYGSEYDGFQDIFTSAVYTNLEWGRFDQARGIIDNYFTSFVDTKGVNNMRGPETAQFGLTLFLLARYYQYTGDAALLLKHGEKIQATASLLTDLHDESLRLPPGDIGYGMIHGWCESDSCLAPNPETWWLPYFSNSAFAARGLKEIASVWRAIHQQRPGANAAAPASDWQRRSAMLREAVVASVRKNIRRDMNPPYIGPFPGTTMTFRESLEKERPSPQQWAHRAYCELLQPDVLPAELANVVIDCMRAYGATTIGVVANVGPARPGWRAILGFISYGYAQMLLRLDRVEEYLLFLYSHGYHDHRRGSWVAGEVSGISGGTALFCIPAQQTIPMLVRWMLALEDSDEDRLYLGKGLPHAWVTSGKPIGIDRAPTRWGRVTFHIAAQPSAKRVRATVELERPGSPRQLHVKLRIGSRLRNVTVNGRPAKLGGMHNDTAIFETGHEKHFEVSGEYS